MQKPLTVLCAVLSLALGLGCTASIGGGGNPDGGPGGGSGVTVSPAAAYLVYNGSVSFSAVVAGTPSSAVNWRVLESGGGTVDASGHYQAPATAGIYHVVATAAADATKQGSAVVTVGSNPVIAPDRLTIWNPGLNAVGGIPSLTTVCKTLSPSGGDDTAAIQSALDSCPASQVVQLNGGTFNITGQGLQMTKSNVVLRGNGPTSTLLVEEARHQLPRRQHGNPVLQVHLAGGPHRRRGQGRHHPHPGQ